jgi:hypothetical protein
MMIRPDFSSLKTGRLFLLLMLLFAACFVFSSLLSLGVVYIVYGPQILNALSEGSTQGGNYAGALRLMQAINHAGSFLCTSLLFILLAESPEGKKQLMGSIPGGNQLWLVFLLIITSTPWIAYVYEWNRGIHLPIGESLQESIRVYEERTEKIIEQMLADTSQAGFIGNLFVMAFLPAIGEELLFRGIIQRLFYRWWRNIHFAVWITAFLFSIMHLSFSGLLPRLMLGVIFGYLFYFTGNIWLPIAAHFLNNSMALLAAFLEKNNLSNTPYEDFGYFSNPWVNFLSIALTIIILAWFAMNKTRRSKDAMEY